MVVTDYNEQFLDKRGTDHLINELKAYIDSIATGDIDLSNYVTKSELQAKLDALDINIDLSSYATKEELTNAINSIDLSAYAKKTDIPSLEGYVTETELNAKGYLTEHQDLSAYALKTEIPSLNGYATTEYVDNAIANVPSGGNVDLSNYYTKAETNALIPSTEGLATKTYVDNAISNIPTTDLTNYATKEYVSTAINSIPATDLSNYYTKSETYSKTEVDTLVANSGSGGGSSSGSGEVYSTEEIAIGKWIDGKTIYRKVISMDLPAVKSGQTHSAVTVVASPCNIMMLDWRAVSYAGLTGSDYDYPSRIIHGDGFKSAVVWTTKRNVGDLTQELCRDMLSVFHAGNPTSSYINCYYGSSFASRRCDFIIDYLKIETT